MQKSDSNQTAKVSHRKVKASTTLNRKYIKRPERRVDTMVKVKRSPKVQRFAQPTEKNVLSIQQEEQIQPAQPHPIQNTANERMRARNKQMQQEQSPKISAKELKDQAIKKALASAATMEQNNINDQAKKTQKTSKMHFGFGRVMLAMACAAAAVFAIVYFVNLNMPDISMRVAAMQTGIDPTYPNYVPRDYGVSSITSEDGKISIVFNNSTNGDSFSLIEERSSWDSNALLSNYVKEEFGESYSTVREQGLTIYINNSDAAWVNGGILYKIKTTSGTLTNKQIRSIAVSL